VGERSVHQDSLRKGPADRYHADVSVPFRQGTNSVLPMVTQDEREWQAGLARPGVE